MFALLSDCIVKLKTEMSSHAIAIKKLADEIINIKNHIDYVDTTVKMEELSIDEEDEDEK